MYNRLFLHYKLRRRQDFVSKALRNVHASTQCYPGREYKNAIAVMRLEAVTGFHLDFLHFAVFANCLLFCMTFPSVQQKGRNQIIEYIS